MDEQIDTQLAPFENFDTTQMLLFFQRQTEKLAFVADPAIEIPTDGLQDIAEFEAKLQSGLSVARLERI